MTKWKLESLAVGTCVEQTHASMWRWDLSCSSAQPYPPPAAPSVLQAGRGRTTLRIASHFISTSQELLGYKLFDSFKKLLAGPQIQGTRKQKVLRKQKPLGGWVKVPKCYQL